MSGGYVYAFGVPGDNLVKIGVSFNPEKRAHELRREILHGTVLFKYAVNDAHRVEVIAQNILHESHLENEWFLATAEQAADAIETAIARGVPHAKSLWRSEAAKRRHQTKASLVTT